MQILRYTGMLLRAYTRDYPALFFSLVFPLIFMMLFGFLNLGAFGHVNMGVVDQAQNADSARFIAGLKQIETLRITTGTADNERQRLEKSDRDIVIVIPADFRIARAAPGAPVPQLAVLTNVSRTPQAGVGQAILTQVIDQTTFAITQTAPVLGLKVEPVNARNLTYVDFLAPGIVGMTIMQSGIAGVAFALVVERQRGVLRRMFATPLTPRTFLTAQVLQRLILTVLQVLVLLAVAVFVFHVQLVGGLGPVLAISMVGAVVFLCMGFAITGICATENQVAPLMQIVTLPQMFLSGVFFSTDAIPALIRPVSAVLPLTYLNDALRAVSTSGATLWDVRTPLIGLGVWIVISFGLAAKFFKLDNA